MSKLVRSTANKLIQVDELRHFFLFLCEPFEEWLFVVLDLILSFPILSHLYSLALCSSLICITVTRRVSSTFLFHIFNRLISFKIIS